MSDKHQLLQVAGAHGWRYDQTDRARTRGWSTGQTWLWLTRTIDGDTYHLLLTSLANGRVHALELQRNNDLSSAVKMTPPGSKYVVAYLGDVLAAAMPKATRVERTVWVLEHPVEALWLAHERRERVVEAGRELTARHAQEQEQRRQPPPGVADPKAFRVASNQAYVTSAALLTIDGLTPEDKIVRLVAELRKATTALESLLTEGQS
jgi:hypothetical protein